jgi:hypothetical protein
MDGMCWPMDSLESESACPPVYALKLGRAWTEGNQQDMKDVRMCVVANMLGLCYGGIGAR